jgi:hypothetical protein
LIVFYDLWAVGAAPKKHQKSNTSIFTRKAMIYSIFINEVKNMRSFVLQAVMTSLGIINM